MVLLKYGKTAVKKYNYLLTGDEDPIIYLKTGEYLLDVSANTLTNVEDADIIDLNKYKYNTFYSELKIDKKCDDIISLTLNKYGIFKRTSGIYSWSTVYALFRR